MDGSDGSGIHSTTHAGGGGGQGGGDSHIWRFDGSKPDQFEQFSLSVDSLSFICMLSEAIADGARWYDR